MELGIFLVSMYFNVVFATIDLRVRRSGLVGQQLINHPYITFVQIFAFPATISLMVFGFINFEWWIPIVSFFGVSVFAGLTLSNLYMVIYPHLSFLSIIGAISIWFV